MKKTINIVLSIIIIMGVGFVGYGGYQHFDMKAQAKASSEEVDDLLNNREEIELTDDDPFGFMSMLKNKDDFMNSGFGHGDGVGKLIIPKIDGELSIVEGVHEDDLEKGVGHDQDTMFPTDGEQTVLSGHRDTVFRDMGKMELGDTMTVSMPYGDFEYKIDDMYIVDMMDTSVIVPHDEETLTVTTCYPFNFVGSAPDRYIIDAKPTFDMDEFNQKKEEYDAGFVH